jgi:hypothetical protein
MSPDDGSFQSNRSASPRRPVVTIAQLANDSHAGDPKVVAIT